MLFHLVSDPAFDKGYAFDFFCLEPRAMRRMTIIARKGVISLRLHRGINNFRDVVAGCVTVIYKIRIRRSRRIRHLS